MSVCNRNAHAAMVGLFLVVAAATAQSPPADAKVENAPTGEAAGALTDNDRLQGRWQIVSIAVEDNVFKREAPPAEWKDSFEKELFVEGDRFGQVGHSNSKLKLDETRDPKLITIMDDDGKLIFRGIYALRGNTLKVCINGDGTDVRRPEEFVTKKGTPLLLIQLKQVGTAKK